jgi:hypothetical protein
MFGCHADWGNLLRCGVELKFDLKLRLTSIEAYENLTVTAGNPDRSHCLPPQCHHNSAAVHFSEKYGGCALGISKQCDRKMTLS